MTFGIFEEVERLIEYIPIDCDTFQIDGRLARGTSIDSKFYFEDIDGIATRLGIIEVIQVEAEKMKGESRFKTLVSFRDIVRLLNKFLKDARIEEVVQKQRYTQLQLIKCLNSSIRNLLFDFCLAALDGDNLDVRHYIHTYIHTLHTYKTCVLSSGATQKTHLLLLMKHHSKKIKM